MERELKWKADEALQNAVAAWASDLCSAETSYEMDARYFDTADGLLSARKAGLRIRSENGECVCCLKCDKHIEGAMHLREEYEAPANTIADGLAALSRVGAPQALCGALLSAGVSEICRMRFTRRALTLDTGEMTAELALDCGILSRGDRSAPLCEIELEYKSGSEFAFNSLTNRLAQAFSLTSEPLSKLARAKAL